MSGTETDAQWMREALLLAQCAADAGEAPIGAVIVRRGEIVGRGYNRREARKNALSHAEIEAIDDACRSLGGWRLWDCTLYVTLEPCPMCAGAILNARVRRVVFGAADPKAGSVCSVQRMFDLPYNHKPEVTCGVLAEDCSALLRSFFADMRRGIRKAPINPLWKQNTEKEREANASGDL